MFIVIRDWSRLLTASLEMEIMMLFTFVSLVVCFDWIYAMTSSKWVQGGAWLQKTFALPKRGRGVHLVTEDIERQIPELKDVAIGVAHVHVLHTSASLAINENWDPSVRTDMEMILTKLIPENGMPYQHSCEGPDDMPAHAKSILIGNSISIPVTDGKFNLGTWQGVYLCEHRDQPRVRNVVVTLNGSLKSGA